MENGLHGRKIVYSQPSCRHMSFHTMSNACNLDLLLINGKNVQNS